jgi:hypothetical protein
LFTSEGELKSEFRDLEDQASPEPTAAVEPPTVEPPAQEPGRQQIDEQRADPSDAETPPTGQGYVSPTFIDLVGVVAQPIALYLGDAKMPDGESLENLELARLYIDLLEILYKKSAGNVTPEEGDFLKDLLYRLRLRFVEKSG